VPTATPAPYMVRTDALGNFMQERINNITCIPRACKFHTCTHPRIRLYLLTFRDKN
jgi:hypothetical protein